MNDKKSAHLVTPQLCKKKRDGVSGGNRVIRTNEILSVTTGRYFGELTFGSLVAVFGESNIGKNEKTEEDLFAPGPGDQHVATAANLNQRENELMNESDEELGNRRMIKNGQMYREEKENLMT